MSKTPLPDAPLDLGRPRVAAALQRARTTLVVRPPANAFDVAQGVLLPMLSSLGVDPFDLEQLRLTGDASAARVEYRLAGESEFTLVAVPLEESLPEPASDVISCNGHDWLLGDRKLELFDDALPRELAGMLRADEDSGSRSAAKGHGHDGYDTGEKASAQRRQPREFVPAGPFERITLDEVRSYAQAVRNMRGKLQVWFDGEQVDVSSRSAYYYLLAELAVRHGREDAIPGDDLIVPPEEPPGDRRARPLARPGWHLLIDHDHGAVEERTLGLLEALGLLEQFAATQRGQPYPSRTE